MACRSYAHYSDSEAAAKAAPITLDELCERAQLAPVLAQLVDEYRATVAKKVCDVAIVEWPDGALVLMVCPRGQGAEWFNSPAELACAYRVATSGRGFVYGAGAAALLQARPKFGAARPGQPQIEVRLVSHIPHLIGPCGREANYSLECFLRESEGSPVYRSTTALVPDAPRRLAFHLLLQMKGFGGVDVCGKEYFSLRKLIAAHLNALIKPRRAYFERRDFPVEFVA